MNFTTPVYFQHPTYRTILIFPLVKLSIIYVSIIIGIIYNPTEIQTLKKTININYL